MSRGPGQLGGPRDPAPQPHSLEAAPGGHDGGSWVGGWRGSPQHPNPTLWQKRQVGQEKPQSPDPGPSQKPRGWRGKPMHWDPRCGPRTAGALATCRSLRPGGALTPCCGLGPWWGGETDRASLVLGQREAGVQKVPNGLRGCTGGVWNGGTLDRTGVGPQGRDRKGWGCR